MSNRTLKKLQNNGSISSVSFPGEVESDLSPDEEKSTNKFTALLADLPTEPDINASMESGSGLVEDDKVKKTKVKQNAKRRRRKKNSNMNQTCENEDEIDRCVREVNELLGEVSQINTTEDELIMREKEQEALLSVSRKYLDPWIEMKRIFGTRVVENERSQQRHSGARRERDNRNKRCVIIGGPAPYPDGRKSSLSMEVDMEQDGCTYYRFVHLPSYQKVQFEFNKIVSSIDPERLLLFLHENPLHIDCLITAAEIHRMAEESSSSAKLLERALHVMENAFHPHFNYSTGKCRMNYKQQENRAFFIAIFRHIVNMENKGCARTALELCKLLLNLTPDADPLGASLMLDYYAIRASEYAWLVTFYDCYQGAKNLSMLPNFSFSVPLALYFLSTQKQRQQDKETLQYKILGESTGKMRERADCMLQEALIMFPGALTLLLDKCSVKADQDVIDHPYFGPLAQTSMTKGLNAVINLFVGRNFFLWKDAGVMQWLEENVKKTIERIDKKDALVAECAEKRKTRYLGTPLPIYRHIVIAEIKDVTISLPEAISKMAVMSHDPLPPADSICGYKFPKEAKPRDAEHVVSSFFRSLMPTYDATGEPIVPNEDEDGEEAAGGGQIRESVQTILDGLRNLAATIRRENPDDDQQQNNQQT